MIESNEKNYRTADCCRMCRHSKTDTVQKFGVIDNETKCTQDGQIVSEIFVCDDFER